VAGPTIPPAAVGWESVEAEAVVFGIAVEQAVERVEADGLRAGVGGDRDGPRVKLFGRDAASSEHSRLAAGLDGLAEDHQRQGILECRFA